MAKHKGDSGGETRADTRAVNAHESDPTLYKEALVGQTIGKCRIEALIGEGKTAVVFRAEYAPLHRTVAVKVLQEHLKKLPAVVKVFQQEGRAVAAMDHENILKIYDVGVDRGHHYLVLELLAGDTLLAEIESHPNGEFPIERALEIVRQAANGLTAAHRKNLVHRDIKPQNMVIEPDKTLKIVDFGLAAEAEGAFSGGRLGTPHYMSPEQCRGEMAGTASDIYALGITLYHRLVGHPPSAGRTTTDEIIEGHLDGQRLEPEKLRRDLPKSVADLVRRMTRMDMARRPSAKDVRDALAKSRPSGDKPATRAARRGRVRGARRRTRQSSPVGLLLVVGVVLLALIAFALVGGEEEDRDGGGATEKTVVAPDPTPERKQKRPKAEKLDRDTRARIAELLKKARKTEQAGNLEAALLSYQQVVLIAAVEGTEAYNEAAAAIKVLKKRIDRKYKGVRPKKGDSYIPVHQSQAAGREFETRRGPWKASLMRLDFRTVLDEMAEFVSKTRKDSAERGVMELALRRARYIENLVKMAETRAAGLDAGEEFWSSYDYNASGDLIVVGASEKGVSLKDQETGATRELAWIGIDRDTLVGFLDTLRSGTSGNQALWMAYYCLLHGDPRADQYFDLALMSDASPEMAAEVRALRGH